MNDKLDVLNGNNEQFNIKHIINEYPELIQYLDVIQTQPGFLDYYDENYIDDDMCIQRNFYLYTSNVIEGRWPEAEPYIMLDPLLAYSYAYDVIQGRWPEAEPYIMKNPQYAYRYALFIIGDKWPEAEPYIMLDPQYYRFYKANVK